MKTIASILLALAAAAIAGCGSDYCGGAQTFEQNAVNRQGSCNGTVVSTNFSHSACEQALSTCSSQDQSELNASVDCLNGLPACTPSTEGAFVGSEIDCAGKASSVSVGCIAALAQADVPALVGGFTFSTCTDSGGACNSGNGSDCCSGTCTNKVCQ
ncbi:MAG TPA: hypothetical protein VMB50_19895 [Myxococcales bacterium]|nr:hypothetical protein [Myxococcales bacterium]